MNGVVSELGLVRGNSCTSFAEPVPSSKALWRSLAFEAVEKVLGLMRRSFSLLYLEFA